MCDTVATSGCAQFVKRSLQRNTAEFSDSFFLNRPTRVVQEQTCRKNAKQTIKCGTPTVIDCPLYALKVNQVPAYRFTKSYGHFISQT